METLKKLWLRYVIFQLSGQTCTAILLKYRTFELCFWGWFYSCFHCRVGLFHGQNNCKIRVSANCRVPTKSWLKKELENCLFCLISSTFWGQNRLNVNNSLYIRKKNVHVPYTWYKSLGRAKLRTQLHARRTGLKVGWDQ